MPNYTAAEKENALRLCGEIGVAKASIETGVSRHTLYKWRTSAEDEIASTAAKVNRAPVAKTDTEVKGAEPKHENKDSRKRYSAEEKANALQLYDKVGVTKASKQTGITINSLRKWQMDARNAIVTASATADEISDKKIATDQNESQTDNESASMDVVARLFKTPVGEPITYESTSEEIIRLRLESAMLKAQIIALKAVLRAFIE